MRSASTLGIGAKKSSNAVSVAFSRRRYPQQDNGKKCVDDYYKPSITPSANRNSFRVAIIVVQLPRVADYARNPGLGKRNSYRVAAADKPHNKRDQQRTPPQSSQEGK